MAAKRTQQEKAVKVLSRNDAANQVVASITGKTTLSALAEKADQLIVDSGGESNPKAIAHHVKRALETAEALGILNLTKPTDVMVEKAK